MRPDVGELLLDQAGRRLEFVPLVEFIEQGALELLAGRRGVLLLKAVAHAVAELGERLHAERFGKVIVHRHRAGRFHRFRRDGEGRLLAGDDGRRVVVGKLDIEGSTFARLDARSSGPQSRG